jgi:hypothetical protein
VCVGFVISACVGFVICGCVCGGYIICGCMCVCVGGGVCNLCVFVCVCVYFLI